jgi:CRISPR system Cascade subunit CasE
VTRTVRFHKKVGQPEVVLGTCLFEGTLQVVREEPLKRALCEGIGPGKAFGMGLLSVAPG